MTGKYDDIVNLPRPESRKPKMPIIDRAAQFAPFAALTKFGEEIKESNRKTAERIYYDDEYMEELDNLLSEIEVGISAHPNVSVTYFVQDERKAGGALRDVTGRVKKVDRDNAQMIFESGEVVPMRDITRIKPID